jgi:branched-subunit amino acid aminotransferase/4-amino-4-deoxychorismate lyase
VPGRGALPLAPAPGLAVAWRDGRSRSLLVATAGYGLIETMRVREGRIPFLERHLARLARSLEALGLPRPSQDIAALVAPFSDTGDAVLRLEVSDGRAAVTVRELPSLDPPAVITASEPHVPYPHKTTERDRFADAAREAVVAEADDALLLTHEGWVAEGTVWNVCWWEGVGVRTPPLELGILPGIGRARVLELAPGQEQRCARPGLEGKSVFLVNAVRGVVPIASLDGARVPVDVRTADLARRFWPAL